MPYYITDQNPECERERSEQRLDSGSPAVIVDIDGTLLFNDGVNERLVRYLDSFDDTEIVIITARLEADRADTVEQLDGFDIDYDQLIMKPDADISSPDFKEEAAKQLLETWNVMVAIDNDSDNRERYRGLGITAIDVDEVPDVRSVDLTAPTLLRAIARRAVTDDTDVNAVSNGNMTPALWLNVRDALTDMGRVLWDVELAETVARRLLIHAEGVIARIEEENEGRAKGQALSKMETRVTVTDFEVREEADGMHLTGYAARFNEASEPLPFREYIAPGAFKASLQTRNDVKLLWNHDSSTVLGSTRAGTLRLSEDAKGLQVSATLPDTQAGRDAKVLINRGDVTGFSFGFTVPSGGDSWNEDGSERTLNAVRLMEVSTGVAFPAYPTTNGTALVRGWDKIAERANVDADALADALLKIESGEDISSDDRQLITTVLDKLSPVEQVEESKGDLDMLALKKKKLELLMGM